MRLIGTLDDERRALIFSAFLHQKGISHQLEVKTNHDWGSSQYGTSECIIWIYEEDQLEEALKWYEHFVHHPEDPIFTVRKPINLSTTASTSSSEPPPIPPWPEGQGIKPTQPTQTPLTWNKQPMGLITRLLLVTCCALFFIAQFLSPTEQVPTNVSFTIFSSPIEKALLYDYPYKYQLINKLFHLYGYEALKTSDELPKEGKFLIEKINQTPAWQGIYSIIPESGFKAIPSYMLHTPMFEKIRQGEWWRLFSPALLHADIFHLFFNMLWLIVLGKQLEQRLKIGRYILFILLTGIVSNTGQYLMSGPNFIGFSGILCAMLTFIWVRQRQAPWEGYQLDRMTLLFIMLFIISMAVLQLVLFFIEQTTEETVSSGIANTAHLSGALIGYILGKFNFFSWRHT